MGECRSRRQQQAMTTESGSHVPVCGLRLCDLRDLVDRHYDWFHEKTYNERSKREQAKTMYDVSPERVIPESTLEELLVVLDESDLQMLTTVENGGILAAANDHTIAIENARLGAQDVPKGFSIHGR